VASSDNAVHLYDVSKPSCPLIPDKVFRREDLVFGVAFSSKGQLAAASNDGSIAVWEIESPDKPVFEKSFNQPMFAVAFSPDGNMLAATGAEGVGYIFDLKSDTPATPKLVLNSGGGTVGQVAFSFDGKMVVATATSDGTAFVADPTTGKILYRTGGGGCAGVQNECTGLFGVAFSSNSKFLLTGSNLSATATLWTIGDRPGSSSLDALRLGSARSAA
jgi:WD40 repeat protein